MGKSDILLTIGMIVKNEKRSLKRCLDALTPLRRAIPCELVIADTGSNDGTREMAEQYADVLLDFEWCNDFSAARNAVMDKSSGRWYLTVDADEYLDANVSELVDFLTSKDADEFSAAVVIQRNYKTFEMREEDYDDCFPLRMLNMATGMRYEGSIHESWPIDDKKDKIALLSKVILHHDGYVKNPKTASNGKEKRNLVLLEKELENSPGNLRRIVQCIESSYNESLKRKYAVMAVETALKSEETEWEKWKAIAFRDAVMIADQYRFSEFEQWTAYARGACPDDFLIMIDVSFLGARYYTGCGDYERCLEELNSYWKGIEAYKKERYDVSRFTAFSVHSASETKQRAAWLMQSFALIKLERYQEALEALEHVSLIGLNEMSSVSGFINCLILLWENGTDVNPSPLLIREWQAMERDESKSVQQIKDYFVLQCGKAFARNKNKEANRRVSDLFGALGEGCDLGRCGLIISSETKGDAERLLSKIENWEKISKEVLYKAMELNARLPEAFYRLNSEILISHAVNFVKYETEDMEKILHWDELTSEDNVPVHILWRFTVAVEAVKGLDWETKGSMQLYDWFCEQTEAYINTFVNETVSCEEYIHLLPAPVRLGWYLLNACKMLQDGDKAGYVRNLRTVLNINPDMKAMITFLTEQADIKLTKQQSAVSNELTALAEKVRAVLEKLPTDDPSVEQLKSSDVYKMVAHIIEK